MNLPNALTLSRIFLIPVILAVLLPAGVPAKELWAGGIFLIAALTDTFDGYLARRLGQVTTVGMLLDPIADKLLISSCFISLVWLHAVPAWIAVIIIGREFAVAGLRNIASSQGFTIQASDVAKAKMVSQVVAIVLILLELYFQRTAPLSDVSAWLHWLSWVSLFMVVVFAVVSAIQYFTRFWRQVDMSIKRSRRSQLIKTRVLKKKSGKPMQVCSAAGQLSGDERRWLLRLAREAVVAAVSHGPLPAPPEPEGRRKACAGVFVSLHAKGDLRGCIGQLNTKQPLYLALIEAARSAASEDPRFSPVSPAELSALEIEISVLSPMQGIAASKAEQAIEIGRHGLVVSQNGRRGLLLPQVPGQYGWTSREFLRQTCRKAGLHPDAWRAGAKLHIFTAEVFSEEKRAEAYSSST
jgi:CDP-diacylglycerol---glycerol-3-phosphate 3-phosphatidyltransferase